MRLSKVLFVFLMSALLFSCSNEQKEDIDDMGDEMRKQKEELQADINESINSIDAKLETLNNDLAEAGEDSKESIQDEIDELTGKKLKLEVKLDEIGDATEEGWEDFKDGVDEIIEDIGDELE